VASRLPDEAFSYLVEILRCSQDHWEELKDEESLLEAIAIHDIGA
jgi:hypothetical protein